MRADAEGMTLDAPPPLMSLTACVALMTAPATAQDARPEADARAITLDLTAEIYTTYFWRGRVIEDQGFIFQPAIDVGFALAEGNDDADPTVDLYVGNWNSFHSEHTGASSDTGVASWHESDFYGGVVFAWDRLALDVGYVIYTYPNSTFNTVQELTVAISYDLDDAGILAWFGDPSLLVGIETDNSNVATDEAVYLELGLGPSFEFLDGRATLSVPVTLGFSLDDYFLDADGDDDVFGFGQVGVAFDYALGSGRLGDWTLSGGVNVTFLGSAMEGEHPTGDAHEVYGFIGIGMSY